MSTDTMEKFDAAREKLALARERARLPHEHAKERTIWHGPTIEDLAEMTATALHEKVLRAGDRWVSLANGKPLSHALMVRVVRDLLPADIAVERREHLAGVLVSSATLRAMLSGR